jgi:hypothetical protein
MDMGLSVFIDMGFVIVAIFDWLLCFDNLANVNGSCVCALLQMVV